MVPFATLARGCISPDGVDSNVFVAPFVKTDQTIPQPRRGDFGNRPDESAQIRLANLRSRPGCRLGAIAIEGRERTIAPLG